MYGLQPGKKIQGKGTGTSDSIKTTVKDGTYIMPADSTQKIGEDQLANMGTSDVPVNLSNGEFEIPPEQVHAIGAQTLDQMKSQTHEHVDQPQLGLNPEGKAELFFANGGVVSPYPTADEIRKAQQARNERMSARELGPKIRDVSGTTRNPSNIQQAAPRPTPQAAPQPTTTSVANTQSNNAANMQKQAQQTRAGVQTALNTRAPVVTPPQFNAPPTNSQIITKGAADAARGIGRAVGGLAKGHVALSGIGGAYTGYQTPTEDYRTRFGMETDNPSFMGDLGVRTLGVLSDVGNAATFGLAGRGFADKQINNANFEAKQQADFLASQVAKRNAQQATPSTAAQTQAPQQGQATQSTVQAQAPSMQAQAPQQTPNNDPYAIVQNGTSFTYANPQAAAAARAQGIPENENAGYTRISGPVSDPVAGASIRANSRQMGATQDQIDRAVAQREMDLGNQMNGFGLNARAPDRPQRTDAENWERQQLMKQATTPIQGARGLTANQMKIATDLRQSDDNRAAEMYRTDTNNHSQMQRDMLGQAGQNYRTNVSEDGQNARYFANLAQDNQQFNAKHALDNQRFNADSGIKNREMNLTETKEGFGIRNAARMESLYQQLDEATTAQDRQSIQQKINRYSGKEGQASGKDRYMTVGGGQEWDDKAGSMVNRPQQIFDTQTTQFMSNTPITPSTNHINGLISNPDTADRFDQIYGPGAAERILASQQ